MPGFKTIQVPKKNLDQEPMPDDTVVVKGKNVEYDVTAGDLAEAQNEIEKVVKAEEGAKGGKRRKQRGGTCSSATRQKIKIAVIGAIAALIYAGGPDAASYAGNVTVDTFQAILRKAIGFECKVSFGAAGVSNALCMKYGELVQGISNLVNQTSTNSALTAVVAGITGFSLAGAWTSLKNFSVKLATGIYSAGGAVMTGIDEIVNQLCKAVESETVERGTVTDISGPVTRSQTLGMRTGDNVGSEAASSSSSSIGGRRRRKTKKSAKKSRKVTRRRIAY